MTSVASEASSTAQGLPAWPTVTSAVALAAGVWVIFAPVLGYEFAGYDIQDQVTDNPFIHHLSWTNLGRIFTQRYVTSYYPVRLLSFAIDRALWGLDPRGFHLTNLLIHTANVLLVYALGLRIRRWTGVSGAWGVAVATVAAGLFAVHPLVVEPIAWVSAREELLMVLGTLATLHFYAAARRRWIEGGRGVGYSVAAVVACLVACGSSAIGAVIPVMVTAWEVLAPGQRKARRVAWTTAPFWAIGVATFVLKVAEPPPALRPPGWSTAERALAALMVYAKDAAAMVWPYGLTPMYPSPTAPDPGDPWVWVGLALVAGTVAAGTALARARWRAALWGLVAVVVAMLPHLQVLAHHIHRRDRFLYLPLAGLSVGLAALGAQVGRRLLRAAVVAAGAMALGVLAASSAMNLPVWRDPVTLHTRMVALKPDRPEARCDLGSALSDAGHPRAAEKHLRWAVALDSDYARARYNLGNLCLNQGRIEDARRQYEQSLARAPDDPYALNNDGIVMILMGRADDAEGAFRRALRGSPYHMSSLRNLGRLLATQGRFEEAEVLLWAALSIDPARGRTRQELADVQACLSEGRTAPEGDVPHGP